MVISGVNTVTYNGDGVTTAWPYTYEVTNASEIRIQLNNADGTAVIVESDYYVDLINSTVYYPGYAPGSEPPEAEQPPKVQEGQTITVYREIPITQESDLGEKWPFEVIEKGLDKLTMIAQQIDSGTKRTIDNALASMELLADVVVDSEELQHITDQYNAIDANAAAAAESEENAAASATAAANSATAASTSATNAANSDASATATAAALTNFLETKETLTAPAVDSTLTISGAAADAKATGDAIKSTKAEMSLFGVDDLLWDNTDPSPTGGNGITITIDKTNKKVTLSGTSTAAVVQNFYFNLTTMPPWIQKGKTYIAHCDTDADVSFEIREKVPSSTSSVLITSTRSHASFKVSDDATGMIIRLYISSGKTVNTTVSPFISELPTLRELVEGTDYMKYLYFPTDTDLNDIKDTRFAFLSFGSDINYQNNPLNNASMGFLLSYKMQNIVTQVVMGVNPAKQFVRRYNSTLNNWSSWENLTNKKSLKYLAVGNSGSQDMLSYVPFIMKNVAPDLDITIGITYASGARIDQQIDYFDNDDPSLQLNLYRAGTDNWAIYSGKTLKECLIYEDWDIISVQQASTYQMLWSYYTQIPDLIDRIVTYVGTDHGDYVGHPVKVGYLAPQVRIASNTPDAQGKYPVIETPTTYSDYMDCVQRALDEYPLEFAIMSGTAIQTARKETTLDQYGDAEFNDGTSGHMNADYTHLQEGIGCMVASYASTLFLLELAGINNRSVLGEGTRPDSAWITAHNIPGTNGSTVVGITDANCLIAQKCAIMAHKKPFEVSTIY